MATIKELREKRNNQYGIMKDILHNANKENRGLNADERGSFDAAEADMQSLDGDIKRLESFAQMQQVRDSTGSADNPGDQNPTHVSAFNKYLRHGAGALSKEERTLLKRANYRGTATQVTGTGNLGGFVVPTAFSNELEVAQQYVGDVEGISRVMNTASGNPLQIPVVDDTATKAPGKAEAAAATVQDINFGQITLNSYNYATMVKVSMELLEDEGVNIVNEINSLAAMRIARSTNEALTIGTGTGQPKGVVTASTLGHTSAGAGVLTDSDLVKLFYSLDKAYRGNARFMVSDTNHALIRQLALKPAQDAPVVRVNQNGELTINGKPVEVNNDMVSTLATAEKPVLFGDFQRYRTRVVGGINMIRLNERYIDELLVGFLVWRRIDGNLPVVSAIKHLAMA